MAGLFAVFGRPQPERAAAAADRLQFSADEAREVVAVDELSAAWTSFDDPALFGPAHDPATGVRVVLSGRVAFEEADWQRAERLGYEGGLAARLLLDAYLARGAEALDRPDGPAAVLVYDPRSREVFLTTDSMGYHPVFLYSPDDPARCVVCTHPDALADDPEVEATDDLVSMAEFASMWAPTPPHTFYREVRYAGPARRWRWSLDAGTVHSEAVWEPFTDAPFPHLDAGAEALADALQGAARRRTLGRLGTTVVFASGGLDSRALLFGAADDADLVGLTLYDRPNHEADIARQVCEAAGARFEGRARDRDYYPRWIPEGTRWSGAMWSAEDNHFLGAWEAVRDLGASTVMSGCTADRMFKASTMERRYKRLFGRNLPVQEVEPARSYDNRRRWVLPVPPALEGEIQARVVGRLADVPEAYTTDRDVLLVEDRRVRPQLYGTSVSGPIMYRIYPYDTPLADRSVADVYARTKAAWKVNADLWGRAIARLGGRDRAVPLAHAGWRPGASTATKLTAFGVGWARRRLRSASASGRADGPATAGSWPRLAWYLQNSPVLRDLWEQAPPEDREALRAVTGRDPWATPPWAGGWSANYAFRLSTLLARWQNRRDDAASGTGGPAGGSALAPHPEQSGLFTLR